MLSRYFIFFLSSSNTLYLKYQSWTLIIFYVNQVDVITVNDFCNVNIFEITRTGIHFYSGLLLLPVIY